MSEVTSRNIPLPMQRKIRKRCGFGCVICGTPLYEYEHMEGWANVRRHVANEITLLCDSHHREKTGGLLPIEDVRKANNDPYNLREGVSKPYALHFSGSSVEVGIGSIEFTRNYEGDETTLFPIVVDTLPLMAIVIDDNHLLINLLLHDENNNEVLRIQNNQLVYKPDTWDIQLIKTKLTLREAPRKFLIEIDFSPPNKLAITRGRFLYNGVEILIRPESICIVDYSPKYASNVRVKNRLAGIVIGERSGLGIHSALYQPYVARHIKDNSESARFQKETTKKLRETGFLVDESMPRNFDGTS